MVHIGRWACQYRDPIRSYTYQGGLRTAVARHNMLYKQDSIAHIPTYRSATFVGSHHNY